MDRSPAEEGERGEDRGLFVVLRDRSPYVVLGSTWKEQDRGRVRGSTPCRALGVVPSTRGILRVFFASQSAKQGTMAQKSEFLLGENR